MDTEQPADAAAPTSDNASRIEQFRGSADAYGVVLILLIAVFAIPGLTRDGDVQRVLVTITACLAAVLGLYVSRIRGWVIWAASAISVITVLAASTGLRIESADIPDALWALSVGALLVASPLAIANRIARHKLVTFRTVLGAVCIYLQIALAFSFLFHAIEILNDGSFTGLDTGQLQYMYFSVVTMTTLGYGDITPVTDAARSAAMIETVLGQVFLVVVVARVVSMVGTDRSMSLDKSEQAPHLHDLPRRRARRHRIRRLFDQSADEHSGSREPEDAEEHPTG